MRIATRRMVSVAIGCESRRDIESGLSAGYQIKHLPGNQGTWAIM